MSKTIVDAPVDFIVRCPNKPPCEKCGGVYTFELTVNETTGSSFGMSYLHEDSCPTLRCEHGVKWKEECHFCEQDYCIIVGEVENFNDRCEDNPR